MAHGFLRAGKPFAADEYIHARMMDGHKIKLGIHSMHSLHILSEITHQSQIGPSTA